MLKTVSDNAVPLLLIDRYVDGVARYIVSVLSSRAVELRIVMHVLRCRSGLMYRECLRDHLKFKQLKQIN